MLVKHEVSVAGVLAVAFIDRDTTCYYLPREVDVDRLVRYVVVSCHRQVAPNNPWFGWEERRHYRSQLSPAVARLVHPKGLRPEGAAHMDLRGDRGLHHEALVVRHNLDGEDRAAAKWVAVPQLDDRRQHSPGLAGGRHRVWNPLHCFPRSSYHEPGGSAYL